MLLGVLVPKVLLEFSFRRAKLRKMAFFFVVFDGHFESTLERETSGVTLKLFSLIISI